MKKYPSGKPVFESIGGNQYNLPYTDELGYESSNIGFECKPYCKDSVLWFYDVQGLKDGLTKDEVLALASVLLELGSEMQ